MTIDEKVDIIYEFLNDLTNKEYCYSSDSKTAPINDECAKCGIHVVCHELCLPFGVHINKSDIRSAINEFEKIKNINYELDQPLIVGDSPYMKSLGIRHFAFSKDGKVYCWLDGRTSLTAISKTDVKEWAYHRPYIKENSNKYSLNP